MTAPVYGTARRAPTPPAWHMFSHPWRWRVRTLTADEQADDARSNECCLFVVRTEWAPEGAVAAGW